MAKKLKGKDLILYVDRGGKMIPVCCGRELSISISSDVIEATKRPQSRWKSFLYEDASYTISSSGLVVIDESYTMNDFLSMIENRETMAFVAMHNEESEVFFSGKILLTGMELNSQYKDVLTYSITAQGDGKLSNVNQYEIEVGRDVDDNVIVDDNEDMIYGFKTGDLLPIDLNINC